MSNAKLSVEIDAEDQPGMLDDYRSGLDSWRDGC